MLLAALSLAACSTGRDATSDIKAPDPAELRLPAIPKAGLLFDRPPPPVTVVRDGPSGELIAGTAPPLVPGDAVDAAVAAGLRPWLTEIERRKLADASQRAAADFTLRPVAWEALDAGGNRTAIGTAVAVDNAYRAVRGQLCRELRQSLIKNGEAHQEQVTLCRRDYDNDVAVWVLGSADR